MKYENRHEKMLKQLNPNTTGNDYFVGDIHGCYDTLMDSLTARKFDVTKDRLISVGDLIDRGPQSRKCLELLSEPWFYAVIGNHEDMMIGCYNGTWDTSNYIRNGGEWFFDINMKPEDQSKMVDLALTMPLMIEVNIGDKKIGVVHADYLEDNWGTYELSDGDSAGVDTHSYQRFRQSLIWGRDRIYSNLDNSVNDVDLIVCGHTPVKGVHQISNVLYIDTGAVYGGGLTILSAEQLLSYIKGKHADFA